MSNYDLFIIILSKVKATRFQIKFIKMTSYSLTFLLPYMNKLGVGRCVCMCRVSHKQKIIDSHTKLTTCIYRKQIAITIYST